MKTKHKPSRAIGEIQAASGESWALLTAGYITGATSWGLMTQEEAVSTRGDSHIEWEEHEIRDDPYYPDLGVDVDVRIRCRETDLTEEKDYSDLSSKWSENTSGLCELNRREIRIELALRMRGKLRDYAGTWWETPALLWAGYIIALFNYGVLEKKDCRYLSLFLPKKVQTLISKIVTTSESTL